MKTNKKN